MSFYFNTLCGPSKSYPWATNLRACLAHIPHDACIRMEDRNTDCGPITRLFQVGAFTAPALQMRKLRPRGEGTCLVAQIWMAELGCESQMLEHCRDITWHTSQASETTCCPCKPWAAQCSSLDSLFSYTKSLNPLSRAIWASSLAVLGVVGDLRATRSLSCTISDTHLSRGYLPLVSKRPLRGKKVSGELGQDVRGTHICSKVVYCKWP